MGNRLCLLGFSGSILSLIFNTLHELNHSGEVIILENIKVDDDVPFECQIPYRRLWHDQYQPSPDDVFCFSMTRPPIKKIVFEFFKNQYKITKDRYVNIKHPSIIASVTSTLSKGIYIEPGCIISPYANIGFGVSINRGITIGHHTEISDFATINPGVHIAGHCTVGEGTSIGIGSSVFDHVHIGKNSVIGGGSVVNKNIPDNVLAFGNPCKVIKELA